MAKRRDNGEGSIRKRKNGWWEGRDTAGYAPKTGKRIIKNVLGKPKAKVGQYTVGQWMDVWSENCAKIKVRPSSHQTYRGYIDHHIKPYIGDIQLNKLTSLDLRRLYKKLLSGGRVEWIEAEKQPKGLNPKQLVISTGLYPLR